MDTRTRLPIAGAWIPISGAWLSISGAWIPTSGTRLSNAGTRLPIAGAWIPISGTRLPIAEHGYQSQGHGYQTPGHGYQSPGHGYQTPTDGNDILDFANQITQVRTVGHQILPDDILLTGELLDQNISAIRMIEVGFYASPSMQLSPNDSSTQKISAERNGSGVFSANIDTGTHQVLYFRAYAQTPRRTALGNVRKISIEGNLNKDNQGPEQEALSILAIDSVEENAGWIRNPWFGRYKNFNNGWIYHFDHGWLYLSSDDFNGIWAWSESRGWVWSKKDYTPFSTNPIWEIGFTSLPTKKEKFVTTTTRPINLKTHCLEHTRNGPNRVCVN